MTDLETVRILSVKARRARDEWQAAIVSATEQHSHSQVAAAAGVSRQRVSQISAERRPTPQPPDPSVESPKPDRPWTIAELRERVAQIGANIERLTTAQ